jgi:hypothetical protein
LMANCACDFNLAQWLLGQAIDDHHRQFRLGP